MVDDTLKELDAWYRDATEGTNRPKLLSKFAMLELCGWIEVQFDQLIRNAQSGKLDDTEWVNEHVLRRTNGFSYGEHLRPMICRIAGEVYARRIELKMEDRFPGELDRLKVVLGELWRRRCGFAHADVATNVAAQQRFDAPSWSLNQFRIVKKLIDHYEESVMEVFETI